MMLWDDGRRTTVVEVAIWLFIALVAAYVFAGCEILNFDQHQGQQQTGAPCLTCPDQTVPSSGITSCSCVPIEREAGVSSCRAEWVGGPDSCRWEAMRQSDSFPDSDVVSRGGEIDPGPPSQGAGRWDIFICECPVIFDADS